MKKASALIPILFFLFYGSPVSAYDPNATHSAVVSATVLEQHFNPPILISPADNALTSNNRETFVWKRPSPLPTTPLHHYDLYLDGQAFASSVSDSITTQTYYAYTVERHDDTFYLYLNTDLSQGYHTWSVVAYSIYDIGESSETRKFYVDSIVPFIKLEKADRLTLNWNTADPSSIPDINLRGLSVSTADPLLSGSVEPYANMQIVLICPRNIPTCRDQTRQGNYPSGRWEHRFYGLIKGLIYTVYISATDAVGNSVIFPEFYLAYGVKTPTPPATITPTTSITPPVIPSVTPEITPIITPTPTPFTPAPPVSPTPPVFEFQIATPTSTPYNYWNLFYIILVIGLPLHLLMAIFGHKISLINIPRFLFVLFFPFLGTKKYQTVPFATLSFYDPDNLKSPWQIAISNIKGFYGLKSPLLAKLFVNETAANRNDLRLLIPDILLPITCLFPPRETSTDRLKRLRHYLVTCLPLPLALACLTSAFALFTQPNYFFLIYLFLSLLLVFSEYLYPHLSKD